MREYRNLVRFLSRRTGSAFELAERSVGGDYETVGAQQAQLLLQLAPPGPFMVIDVGCGAGRTASALRHVERLSYLGTDVVPAVLEFARRTANRPDWRFQEVTSLAIPAPDECADIVLFMSVFTHLRPVEVQALLGEAARVLKPGAAAICSYLNRANPEHVGRYRPPWRQRIARLLGRDVMISFTTQAQLSAQIEVAGLDVEQPPKGPELGQCVLIARKRT